jgi:hypothetical protein
MLKQAGALKEIRTGVSGLTVFSMVMRLPFLLDEPLYIPELF